MPTLERDVPIINKYGLHARPAMQLVETANRYASNVQISNGEVTVDGKSIMSVMRLAATKGTTLKFIADGEDAAEALDELEKLVSAGFNEMTEEEKKELGTE